MTPKELSSDLSGLLSPRSVAVIGASTRRGTIGGEIFHNLIANGFQGPVYPVHPKATAVQSVRAYPDVQSIPDPVDLAVVVVPKRLVHSVVEACAAKGVRGVVVISAGYRETGPQGLADETALRDLVRAHGMRMIGPNCLGVLSTDPAVRLDATFAPTYPPEGNVAIASQSGALGLAILDYAREFNIGISDFVSMGNKTDVSGNDLISWWDKDERTDVILLYLESFGNPRRFVNLAREITRRKPIVAVKSGRSPRGSSAASSHTGALAGAEVAVDALMAQTGVVRVDTVEELFDMAAFLAHQPAPAGNRLGILTNAGGPGILATDACAAWNLEIPDLSPETTAALQDILPPEASVKNPVDMIASASAEQYERAMRLMLKDPAVDSLLVIFVPPIVTDPSEVGRAIVAGAADTKKPVVSCFLGRQGVPEALGMLKKAYIPSYAFPETAVRTLARATRHGEWLRREVGRPVRPAGIDRDGAEAVLERARARAGAEERGWLNRHEVEAVLGAYGIRFPEARSARTAAEAVEAAGELGFPVVLKLDSDTIAHKSDVGGVRLDLRHAAEVEAAFDDIRAALAAEGREAEMKGVTLQPLVQKGVEVIVGMSHDPQFGPLVLFGLGGVQVELMKDVAFRLPPLSGVDVEEMVREIKGYPLLEGYRGAPPADVDALKDLLLRVSCLAGDLRAVREMDLNPVKVFARGQGCVAVDARMLVDYRRVKSGAAVAG